MTNEGKIKHLTHEYRGISDMELRIEDMKTKKLEYIKSLEKRFRRSGSTKDAENRLKDFLERNPKSMEAKKLKNLEETLRHVIKQLKNRKEHVKKVENDLKNS